MFYLKEPNKETILKTFKKKAKYIKKQNLFDLGDEKLCLINEFLAVLSGFKSYYEFINTNFSINDPRFDTFYDYYKINYNKAFILSVKYLLDKYPEKNELLNLINENNTSIIEYKENKHFYDNIIETILERKDLYPNYKIYQDLLILDGINKNYSFDRFKNIFEVDYYQDYIPKLFILSTFNSLYSFSFIENSINNMKAEGKKVIVANLTNYEYYYSCDKNIKNRKALFDYIYSSLKDRNNKERKELFVLLDNKEIGQGDFAPMFAQIRGTGHNLTFITSSDLIAESDYFEISSIFANSNISYIKSERFSTFERNNILNDYLSNNDNLNNSIFKKRIEDLKVGNAFVLKTGLHNNDQRIFSFIEKSI